MKKFLKFYSSGKWCLVLVFLLSMSISEKVFAQTDLKVKKVEVDQEKRSIEVEVEGGVGPYSYYLAEVKMNPLKFNLEQQKTINTIIITFSNCEANIYQVSIEDSQGKITSTNFIRFKD